MGVLNVTPDSFSDGGKFFDAENAVDHGLRMAAEGAHIVDVGGESTRPAAEAITAEEELRRVIPVIEQLRRNSEVIISIDTSKAEVARAAIRAGASIVNDVTGGRSDEEMMPLIAETKSAFIIMHMKGTPQTMQVAPQYTNVVSEVSDFFRQQYARAIVYNIDTMAIAFDPGIGFGKTLEHNLELLAQLERLRTCDRPIVIGVSRKSFLGKLIDSAQISDRLAPAVALTSLLRTRGADVLRVHDKMIHQLIDLWFRGWRSLVEILLLSVAIYYGYLYFRGTRGAKVLTGLAIVFLTLTLISTLLNLVVIGWIVRSFSVFLAVALVVIFQPELRRGLAALGGHPIFSLTSEKRETVHDLAEAVMQLANKQFGALIAIERDTSIRVYEETGVTIDGDFSVELILTIFHPKAALHDGGVIIRNGRIAAAACIFPVSQRETLDRSLGLRHRAGLGITEESDAVAVVVSEETGSISICHRRRIERNFTPETFRQRIAEILLHSKYEENNSEKLAGEVDLSPARDNALVPDQKERSDDALAV